MPSLLTLPLDAPVVAGTETGLTLALGFGDTSGGLQRERPGMGAVIWGLRPLLLRSVVGVLVPAALDWRDQAPSEMSLPRLVLPLLSSSVDLCTGLNGGVGTGELGLDVSESLRIGVMRPETLLASVGVMGVRGVSFEAWLLSSASLMVL